MQTTLKTLLEAQMIIEETSIPPKVSTTISLGLYEGVIPEPEFEVDYQPTNIKDDVRAMFVKVPQGGEYHLQCVFQNFSSHPFKAVIREKHA